MPSLEHVSEKGVAAVAPEIAAAATADLAPYDLATQVVLRTVGVQREVRAVKHEQQLGLAGVKPRQQAIEAGIAGAPFEDAIRRIPTGSGWDGRFAVLPVLTTCLGPRTASAGMVGRRTSRVARRNRE